MLDTLAGDGKDSSLHRLDDRLICDAVSADEPVSQLARSYQTASGELLIKSLEKLRQYDARIAACSEKHPVAEGL